MTLGAMSLRRICFVFTVSALAAACVDKLEPAKGEIDPEVPPGSPLPGPTEGKSDSGGTVLTFALESPHPYGNNLDRVFAIDLAARVPSCAVGARVHFTSIRTEAGYDYLRLIDSSGEFQAFDGDRTDVWSAWGAIGGDKRLQLRLETDDSVVKDGFRVDAVEYMNAVLRCPAPPTLMCPAGQVDVTPVPGPCECRGPAQCAPDASVRLEHAIGGGFAGTVTGARAVGTTASRVVSRPGQPDTVTALGTIDHQRLSEVVRFVVEGGYLARTGAAEVSNWNETVAAAIAPRAYSSTRPQGTHPAADAQLIAQIDGLFRCDAGGALTCNATNQCQAGQCVARTGCVCPANYEPVCGVDGATFSNACAAGCAQVAVRHTGECGLAGDPCGGQLARACTGGNRCRYGASQFAAPFPDAQGACVAQTYCDAPADCGLLPHAAVPGTWACAQNACAWRAGVAWQGFGSFATAHPYGNRASVWKEVTAPAGATKVRLVVNGGFDLEAGYDFLEVYSWTGSAWAMVKRYTGTVGPALTDALVGRYHYLRLVSDSTIVRAGFDVGFEWAN